MCYLSSHHLCISQGLEWVLGGLFLRIFRVATRHIILVIACPPIRIAAIQQAQVATSHVHWGISGPCVSATINP